MKKLYPSRSLSRPTLSGEHINHTQFLIIKVATILAYFGLLVWVLLPTQSTLECRPAMPMNTSWDGNGIPFDGRRDVSNSNATSSSSWCTTIVPHQHALLVQVANNGNSTRGVAEEDTVLKVIHTERNNDSDVAEVWSASRSQLLLLKTSTSGNSSVTVGTFLWLLPTTNDVAFSDGLHHPHTLLLDHDANGNNLLESLHVCSMKGLTDDSNVAWADVWSLVAWIVAFLVGCAASYAAAVRAVVLYKLQRYGGTQTLLVMNALWTTIFVGSPVAIVTGIMVSTACNADNDVHSWWLVPWMAQHAWSVSFILFKAFTLLLAVTLAFPSSSAEDFSTAAEALYDQLSDADDEKDVANRPTSSDVTMKEMSRRWRGAMLMGVAWTQRMMSSHFAHWAVTAWYLAARMTLLLAKNILSSDAATAGQYVTLSQSVFSTAPSDSPRSRDLFLENGFRVLDGTIWGVELLVALGIAYSAHIARRVWFNSNERAMGSVAMLNVHFHACVGANVLSNILAPLIVFESLIFHVVIPFFVPAFYTSEGSDGAVYNDITIIALGLTSNPALTLMCALKQVLLVIFFTPSSQLPHKDRPGSSGDQKQLRINKGTGVEVGRKSPAVSVSSRTPQQQSPSTSSPPSAINNSVRKRYQPRTDVEATSVMDLAARVVPSLMPRQVGDLDRRMISQSRLWGGHFEASIVLESLHTISSLFIFHKVHIAVALKAQAHRQQLLINGMDSALHVDVQPHNPLSTLQQESPSTFHSGEEPAEESTVREEEQAGAFPPAEQPTSISHVGDILHHHHEQRDDVAPPQPQPPTPPTFGGYEFVLHCTINGTASHKLAARTGTPGGAPAGPEHHHQPSNGDLVSMCCYRHVGEKGGKAGRRHRMTNRHGVIALILWRTSVQEAATTTAGSTLDGHAAAIDIPTACERLLRDVLLEAQRCGYSLQVGMLAVDGGSSDPTLVSRVAGRLCAELSVRAEALAGVDFTPQTSRRNRSSDPHRLSTSITPVEEDLDATHQDDDFSATANSTANCGRLCLGKLTVFSVHSTDVASPTSPSTTTSGSFTHGGSSLHTCIRYGVENIPSYVYDIVPSGDAIDALLMNSSSTATRNDSSSPQRDETAPVLPPSLVDHNGSSAASVRHRFRYVLVDEEFLQRRRQFEMRHAGNVSPQHQQHAMVEMTARRTAAAAALLETQFKDHDQVSMDHIRVNPSLSTLRHLKMLRRSWESPVAMYNGEQIVERFAEATIAR